MGPDSFFLCFSVSLGGKKNHLFQLALLSEGEARFYFES